MDKIQGLRNNYELYKFEHLDDEKTNHIEKLIIELIIDQLEMYGDDEIMAIGETEIEAMKDMILNEDEFDQLFADIISNAIERFTRQYFEENFSC